MIQQDLKKNLIKFKNVNFANSISDAIKESDLVIFTLNGMILNLLILKNYYPNQKIKIYDMRNIFSPNKIKSQGFKYFGIGR